MKVVPFNHTFKASTGMTPREFLKQADFSINVLSIPFSSE
jgi:methylphosphotriester-DNA--protein-cysteine methyltransferase